MLAHWLSANEVSFKQLPAEARQTLALIKAGGPFPYAKDGSVFGNREGLLPKRNRGYYREYTVKTPGREGPRRAPHSCRHAGRVLLH